VRDFRDEWLKCLQQEGRIAPINVTLLYCLMTHGAGGMFALPALTTRLGNHALERNPTMIQAQANSAVSVIFDGLLP
jgi:hypothetical protein